MLSGGKTASAGIATGRVFILNHEDDIDKILENSILVAKTMSPNYAKVMGKIKGIITDIGSITSHLASVAREFGIPAIVDTQNATSLLSAGEIITISANTATVYKGIVEGLIKNIKPAKKLIFESPVHRRMRSILDRISPLNLTDTGHPSFSPEGCRTFHDIIRFTHEYQPHKPPCRKRYCRVWRNTGRRELCDTFKGLSESQRKIRIPFCDH